MADCLYIASDLRGLGTFADNRLDATTERHKIALQPPPFVKVDDAAAEIEGRADGAGVVLALKAGFLTRAQMRIAARALARRRRTWLYWPAEGVVECVDHERLRSLWHLWLAINVGDRLLLPASRLRAAWKRAPAAARWMYRGELPIRRYDILARLQKLLAEARPIPWLRPRIGGRVAGVGLYLRTDFWVRLISGGSYGHTCYVAKELARVCDHFACATPNRYPLLDDMGVLQMVMEPPRQHSGEDAIVSATDEYLHQLRVAYQALRPAFVYERLCLGNFAGAILSRELEVPYIVEYNGSEISMSKSFDGVGYFYEEVFQAAEMLAFRQAAAISVVSEHIKSELVVRGVDATRILVNPNGADLDAYAPPTDQERAELRASLGFGPDDVVVGFTGTFGGWHGVDVLAAALPRVCAAAPSVRFLLIGDGNLKHVVDGAIAMHNVEARVTAVGRVPQQRGALMLKACDVFLSPHNSHMIDGKFFGSPTKIFEYMATGGAIVASDLEQIGVVLSPALRPADICHRADVTDERAVLCRPGSVDDVVDAVVALAARPHLRAALGRNARQAVADHYSWERHVERLLSFVETRDPPVAAASPVPERPRVLASPAANAPIRPAKIETGDAYKDQVQHQWDNNPVGAQHGSGAPRTLEWFLKIEAHRYGEYAPWMPEVMEFAQHAGEHLLELGGGLGTDLAQFAKGGAHVTDVDLSGGHLALARENFRLRGLEGTFIHHDAETVPFDDNTFDLVYSNGVIHHTPNTAQVVAEIRRVLKPSGLAIVMVYAENSLHYWRNLVLNIGVIEAELTRHSMGEIMSRSVERTDNDARPLVKVYTPKRLRRLFREFTDVTIDQRQMVPDELPKSLRWMLPLIERRAGWNLIIKARKPSV